MARTWSGKYSLASLVFKVNGKAGNEITLTAADVGAASADGVSALTERVAALEQLCSGGNATAWLGSGYLGTSYLSEQ
jgi:hypothetical protein